MNRRTTSLLLRPTAALAAVQSRFASVPVATTAATARSVRAALFHEAEQAAHDLGESTGTSSTYRSTGTRFRKREVGE